MQPHTKPHKILNNKLLCRERYSSSACGERLLDHALSVWSKYTRLFEFELKGGTSLSKGFDIIKRFSEDIDIRYEPPSPDVLGFDVFTGKNQTKKPYHIESRKNFYDWLAKNISIDGIVSAERDHAFDDDVYRSGGIRLNYESKFESLSGLKEGILLEIGFDDTTPNENVTMSSWAYDKAVSSVTVLDSRVQDIKCYNPGYTIVEKLQAISTKFRQQQEPGTLPTNFLRHYYDVSQLLHHPIVQEFIGTEDYHKRKSIRFRKDDNLNIAENEAFLLSKQATRDLYTAELDKIIAHIHTHINKL